ncbi:MAG: PAS domain-containing sensor histidine kinase, partial [Deltaproteobacteria bacterium]|nr:PAS domain-containing sensor histidine kinase [Deltaproteobacteria bacterium]
MSAKQTDQESELQQKKKELLLVGGSEAKFRRLFETAQDGILLLNAKMGRITSANPFLLKILGHPLKKLLGKRLWELGFFKDVTASKAAFKVLQRTGYARYDNLPLETKSGKIMEVEFISNAYRVGSEEVIQCNIRDVSERKRLDDIRDDCISTAAHEIRSPLAVLKMGIDDLEENLTETYKEGENNVVEILKRNVSKLTKLINDLLDLSKLESGKSKISPQTVQMNSLTKRVVQECQSRAREKGLVLEEEYEKNLPEVTADPDLLTRTLINLLDNAFRFAKSKVLVTVCKVDKNIKVSVIDDGPGLRPQEVPIIFDKFVQIHRPVNGNGNGYKGTGLGLAICREMMDRQGGKIWAESVQGKGSQFYFSIPLKKSSKA